MNTWTKLETEDGLRIVGVYWRDTHGEGHIKGSSFGRPSNIVGHCTHWNGGSWFGRITHDYTPTPEEREKVLEEWEKEMKYSPGYSLGFHPTGAPMEPPGFVLAELTDEEIWG